MAASIPTLRALLWKSSATLTQEMRAVQFSHIPEPSLGNSISVFIGSKSVSDDGLVKQLSSPTGSSVSRQQV